MCVVLQLWLMTAEGRGIGVKHILMSLEGTGRQFAILMELKMN